MPAPKNRRRATLHQMRLVSIGALIVTLFTLGAIALVRITALGVGRSVKENISFSIELPQADVAQNYAQLQQELRRIVGIKGVEYIDADSAARMVADRLGENPVDVLGYNPMSPILKLQLQADYMHPDSLRKIQTHLSDYGLSAQLSYRGDLLDTVGRNMGYLQWILWGVVLLQAVFTFIQINNTTRMMIHADRMKIRTLSLVGASPWFIRRPIILKSIADGLIASILTIALLVGAVFALEQALGIEIRSLLPLNEVLLSAGVLLLIAMISCALASWRASQSYIRMNGSKIHLI